jgi:hypothetical protein
VRLPGLGPLWAESTPQRWTFIAGGSSSSNMSAPMIVLCRGIGGHYRLGAVHPEPPHHDCKRPTTSGSAPRTRRKWQASSPSATLCRSSPRSDWHSRGARRASRSWIVAMATSMSHAPASTARPVMPYVRLFLLDRRRASTDKGDPLKPARCSLPATAGGVARFQGSASSRTERHHRQRGISGL